MSPRPKAKCSTIMKYRIPVVVTAAILGIGYGCIYRDFEQGIYFLLLAEVLAWVNE